MELTKEHFEEHLATSIKDATKNLITKDYFEEHLTTSIKDATKDLVSKEHLDKSIKDATTNLVTKDYFEEHLTTSIKDATKNLVSKDYFEKHLDEKLTSQTEELKKYADEQTENLARIVNKGFEHVDERFVEVNTRLDSLDEKLEKDDPNWFRNFRKPTIKPF